MVIRAETRKFHSALEDGPSSYRCLAKTSRRSTEPPPNARNTASAPSAENHTRQSIPFSHVSQSPRTWLQVLYGATPTQNPGAELPGTPGAELSTFLRPPQQKCGPWGRMTGAAPLSPRSPNLAKSPWDSDANTTANKFPLPLLSKWQIPLGAVLV